MNQSSSQPTQSKTAAAGAFAASSIVAVLVTHYVARSLFRIVMPKNSDLPDQMKQTAGGLFATATIAAVGYGIAVALFNVGMAKLYPETHSRTGFLQQLYEATKHVNVADNSSDGFYSMATDRELQKFYPQLNTTPNSPPFSALVLEIRRRIEKP